MNRSRSCGIRCGSGGTLACVALLCWFGVPAAVAAVSRLGLGFALVNPILIPIIVAALGLVAWGLWLGVRSHGRAEPLMIGLVGSLATIIGLFTWEAMALMGFLIVIGAVAFSTFHMVGLAGARA